MKELMQQTIRILKDKVNHNLEIIKENQQHIKEILKEPYSDDRSRRLKERYDTNKTLLMENNDFINVQLTLINFIDKYKNSVVMAEVQSNRHNMSSHADFFQATIAGELPYDQKHPFFNDEEFFGKLLNHFQNREDYEMCSKLIRTKGD
jgi:hypothetical protein